MPRANDEDLMGATAGTYHSVAQAHLARFVNSYLRALPFPFEREAIDSYVRRLQEFLFGTVVRPDGTFMLSPPGAASGPMRTTRAFGQT